MKKKKRDEKSTRGIKQEKDKREEDKRKRQKEKEKKKRGPAGPTNSN